MPELVRVDHTEPDRDGNFAPPWATNRRSASHKDQQRFHARLGTGSTPRRRRRSHIARVVLSSRQRPIVIGVGDSTFRGIHRYGGERAVQGRYPCLDRAAAVSAAGPEKSRSAGVTAGSTPLPVQGQYRPGDRIICGSRASLIFRTVVQ